MAVRERSYCECCKQATAYELEIDRGTIDIVKAMAAHIRQKGINAVHPRKELEGKGLTSNQVGNLSRPRFHGLIAKIPKHSGNYCLTRKGLAFLNGESVPKVAIIRKGTSEAPPHNAGYLDEMTTIHDFDEFWSEYWSSNGYEIQEGRVIIARPTWDDIKAKQQQAKQDKYLRSMK